MTDRVHAIVPRRHESLKPLAFVLFAVPSLWALRLVVNYGIASHFCFPGEIHHDALPTWAWPTMLGINLLTVLVATAAALFSYRNWTMTHADRAGATAPLVEIGEGRSRFLSFWALMIGIGFLIATGFDLVGLWIVPVCG